MLLVEENTTGFWELPGQAPFFLCADFSLEKGAESHEGLVGWTLK